jgi:hypothetical protein
MDETGRFEVDIIDRGIWSEVVGHLKSYEWHQKLAYGEE